MEDQTNNEDDNISKQSNYYDKRITDLHEEKELKIKWHKEILENASMQEHFKNFHPASIDTFITFYLSEKYFAYKYADTFEQRIEEKRSRWIDEAHEHLKTIQHKKLFDLQCLWRAEQLTLEGVQICYDFEAWGEDILNCPFLEPITKDDIRMYQEFLLTADIDFREVSSLYELQNYDQIKEEYTSDDDVNPMPDWYDYHNVRTGNSALLLLPDTRGEKEDFYTDLFRKDRDKDLPPRAPYVMDDRPFLSTSSIEKVMFFVNTFEDEETQKKYANYKEINKRSTRDEEHDVSELIMYMDEEEEYIPIEAHYDYREALYKAYNSFKLKKLAEHMPLAQEQYLFNRKMGFTIDAKDNFYSDLRDKYLEMILKGRELNGEEKNLEF